MSNTSLTSKVSAVARLDARARHRRRGARRDPADRVPRPVPLERQRLDRAEPRARREEPDPEGHLGHRHRREAALPGGDALEGRPQGRRDLRPGVPQRPRRRRGHLPRPADHDRRPERRPHRRDPDPAQREAARGGDPGVGARGLVGYVSSGDRVDIYYETGSNGGTVLGLLAPNVLVMRAPAPTVRRRSSGPTRRRRRRSRSRPTTGTLWFLLRPAGDAKNAAEEVDHEHSSSSRRSTDKR